MTNKPFQEVKAKFLDAWKSMGDTWGIARPMAQIHGLLMISEKPLSTDDVMRELVDLAWQRQHQPPGAGRLGDREARAPSRGPQGVFRKRKRHLGDALHHRPRAQAPGDRAGYQAPGRLPAGRRACPGSLPRAPGKSARYHESSRSSHEPTRRAADQQSTAAAFEILEVNTITA